ncbi:tetratricopeptide repeat protein [Streptomyces sp. NPDC054834]
MVQVLQQHAVSTGYVPRSEGWWSQRLRLARAEKDSARGGRRRKTAPGDAVEGPVLLPPAPTNFTGRDRELTQLLTWLDPVREQESATVVVSALAGMGGIGKTALALHAAHRAWGLERFPGGILFANFHGYSPHPEDEQEAHAILGQFLRALGIEARDLPENQEERLQRWRGLCNALGRQGRPILIVLDNVRSSGAVAALLPGHPHRALITSRARLRELPAAHHLDLAPLSPAEAVDLLDRALRAGGTDDDRVSLQRADARRLAELCGYLPLALRIVAALLRERPSQPLAAKVAALSDTRTRLKALRHPGHDEEQRPLAVEASIDLSYRTLTREEQLTFRLFAQAPGLDMSTEATAALLGSPDAEQLLASLHRHHFLQEVPGGGERWTMHDLIRLFAEEEGRQNAVSDQFSQALTRLLDHYLQSAEAAHAYAFTAEPPDGNRFSGRGEALAWLDAELDALTAAALVAWTVEHPASIYLARALAQYCKFTRRLSTADTLHSAALAVSREIGHAPWIAGSLMNLGIVLQERRPEEAIELLVEASEIFAELGDIRHAGQSLVNLSAALLEARKPQEALEYIDLADQMFEAIEDPHGKAINLLNKGNALRDQGHYPEAIVALAEATKAFRQFDDLSNAGLALNNLAAALRAVGESGKSFETLELAKGIFQQLGDRHGEAQVLSQLGSLFVRGEMLDEAIDFHQQAVSLFKQLNDQVSEGGALLNFGVALIAARRYNEALTANTEAVNMLTKLGDRRGSALAWDNLGMTLRFLNQSDKAIEAFETAVSLYGEDDDFHADLARKHLHEVRPPAL